jgi:Protein of unknown function (DUF1059)
MPVEYTCDTCDETFSEETAADLIKRAAAHHHQHHGGPAEITPEIEAAIRVQMSET